MTTTRFNNRELSWLDFDARVLALATDPAVPVLERAKFLAIFGQNLDEFYQVRVAGLLDQVEAGIVEPTPDGMTPAQQLAEISDRVEELVARADEVFVHGLLPALNAEGISFCTWDQLDVDNRRHLRQVFDDRILPILTPLAVDPAHPFPEISNLSLNLALRVVDPDDSEERFARLKIPPALPRYIPTLDENRLLPIEELVSAHLDRLFIGMKIEEYQTFRVTRNADLDLSEEDADDLLELVEMEIRRR
ncbi:MAG: RNA degradosome polyphosphate kinase, partial [Microthrixaceae bacterium]|nr:RNA degradosome polyphosphate kinase [Microthrixaceae bacterium]